MWQGKKWLLRATDEQLAAELACSLKISEVIARILASRGLQDVQAAQDFLFGSRQPFHPPELLCDLPKAVARICQAMARQEKITVYGDYDVDGITATSLLKLFFQRFDVQVDSYIPIRQSEGYGLNSEALAKIAAGGSTLVITVDCGISSVAELANAPTGLDVIITDHHTPPAVLPNALAVINPKRPDCQYPYKELAGVGVAFKLCQGLWKKLKNTEQMYERDVALAALGTVADVVALTGENREIVKLGLAEINEKKNLGIRELVKVAALGERTITAGHLGFMLGPRLNAAGRLTNAKLGVELLTSCDEQKASELAQLLDGENQQRQAIEKDILAEAESMLAEQGRLEEVIVLAKAGWHLGVIGIVASRLVEKYHRPVVMISIGEEICKASCRSISAFDMYAALTSAREYLEVYGGHHQAAGFSIKVENIELLQQALLAYAKQHLNKDDYLPVQRIDVVMEDFQGLDEALLEQLACLEPCGMGNPSPVLAVQAVGVKQVLTMGTDGKHLKFVAEKNKKALQTLFWNRSQLYNCLYDGATVDIAFVPELNEWRNEKSINLRLLDIRQEQVLIDLRQQAADARIKSLQAIMQSEEQPWFYCEQADKWQQLVQTGKVFDKNLPDEKSESIIFLQPPYLLLNDQAWWQKVKKASLKRAYLLYNRDDVEELLPTLSVETSLRSLYKLIKAQGKIGPAQLAQAASSESIEMLVRILQEINAVAENEAGEFFILPVAQGIKLDLNTSATYKNLLQQQAAAKRQLCACLDMGRGDFYRLLFG